MQLKAIKLSSRNFSKNLQKRVSENIPQKKQRNDAAFFGNENHF